MKTFSIRDSSVNGSSKEAEISLARAVKSLTGGKKPVFVCIGTDAVTGDSLGPLTGTVLSGKLHGKAYVLGTLDRPLTALDVNIASEFVKKVYPYGVVVAVDAALGRKEEVGSVLVSDFPVKPGLGVRKNLDEIGDVSVIGVVDEKKEAGGNLSSVRLSLVYRLANLIANGLETVADSACEEVETPCGKICL